MSIIGTYTESHICQLHDNLCCTLETEECVINIIPSTPNQHILLLPIHLIIQAMDSYNLCLILQCHVTINNNPICNQIPTILLTQSLPLIDAVFISNNSILVLLTDDVNYIILIQECSIFITSPQCKILPSITIQSSSGSTTNTNGNGHENEINVISYDKCNILISIISQKSLILYNYCDELQSELFISIENIHNGDVFDSLHYYLTHYRIPNLHGHYSPLTCFIVPEHHPFQQSSIDSIVMNCISFNILHSTPTNPSILTTTLSPTISPSVITITQNTNTLQTNDPVPDPNENNNKNTYIQNKTRQLH